MAYVSQHLGTKKPPWTFLADKVDLYMWKENKQNQFTAAIEHKTSF